MGLFCHDTRWCPHVAVGGEVMEWNLPVPKQAQCPEIQYEYVWIGEVG